MEDYGKFFADTPAILERRDYFSNRRPDRHLPDRWMGGWSASLYEVSSEDRRRFPDLAEINWVAAWKGYEKPYVGFEPLSGERGEEILRYSRE